ncbi:MAG: methyl-accepting chemotaxis protein, partial [Comamonadaceae bacterium]
MKMHMNQAKEPLLYTSVFGVAATAAILTVGGFSPVPLVLAVLMLAAGWGMGWHLSTRQKKWQHSVNGYLASQVEFGEQVIPVWKNHIESSRD